MNVFVFDQRKVFVFKYTSMYLTPYLLYIYIYIYIYKTLKIEPYTKHSASWTRDPKHSLN